MHPVLTVREPGKKLRLAVLDLDSLISIMKAVGYIRVSTEEQAREGVERVARGRCEAFGDSQTIPGGVGKV